MTSKKARGSASGIMKKRPAVKSAACLMPKRPAGKSEACMLKRPAAMSGGASAHPHLARLPQPRYEEWGPVLAEHDPHGLPAPAGRNPLAKRDQESLQASLQQLQCVSLPDDEVKKILHEVARLNLDATTIEEVGFRQAMDTLEHKVSEQAAAMCRRLKKRCEDIIAMHPAEHELRTAAQTVVAHVRNRSLISHRRKGGMPPDDPRLYEGLMEVPGVPTKDIVGRYRERQIMSVKRSSEPTTVALRALCCLGHRRMLKSALGSSSCISEAHVERMAQRATVLTMLVWRHLGGTVFLAAKIGFLTSWGPKERKRVQDIARSVRDRIGSPLLKGLEAWNAEDRKGVEAILRHYRPGLGQKNLAGVVLGADAFFTPGYFPPSFLHSAAVDVHDALESSDEARVDFDMMLDDALAVADRLWSKDTIYNDHEPVLDAILRISRQNVSWRDACYAARRLFGEKAEHPKFGAKELVQDLLDLDWIFPKGRAAVRDLGLFSPVGPGAVKGLLKALARDPDTIPSFGLPPEEEVVLLQCVYEQVLELQCKAESHELIDDLHDLQYNFCEVYKILRKMNLCPRRGPSGQGKKVQTFKRKADMSWGGGEPLSKRRSRFVAAEATSRVRRK